MAIFVYTHVNSVGQESRGMVDAASLGEARRRLRASGIHVVEIALKETVPANQQTADSRRTHRVGGGELSAATRQLSVVMLAGMPLVNALSTLVEQLGDCHLGRVFAQVRDSVNEGASLAKALKEYPTVFPDIYVNMVEAGEMAGTLEEVLSRLADLYERRAKLTGKVKAALAYPIFMIVVGFSVVVFVLSFVLPSVTKLFVEMKMRLPWPTVVLIRTTDVISRYFWILAIVGVCLGAMNVYWARSETGRRFWDRFKLGCPMLGPVVRKVAVSRFCRTLGVLLASGVSIVEALKLAERVAGNTVIATVVANAGDAISHGEPIAQSLSRSDVFPPLVVNMIAVGEQSGTVEEGLSRIADLLDNDVETRLSALTSLLEPIMILVLGVIVGFIVLAMLLPIFDINQAIA